MFEVIDQVYDPAIPIDSISPHPDNPRDGDIGSIAVSIEENGFYGGILIQKSTMFIVAGNHRYLAAKAKGAKTVPGFIADIDDLQAAKIMAVDNRSNDLAGYHDKPLADLLKRIAEESPTGLLGTGYDGDDLDTLLAKIERDNRGLDKNESDGEDGESTTEADLAALFEKYPVQPGDLWRAFDKDEGVNHWLLCGDSRAASSWDHLLDGGKADLVIGDPPYGIAYDLTVGENREGSKGERAYAPRKTIENDDLSEDEFRDLISDLLDRILENTDDRAAVYLFTGSDFSHIQKSLMDEAFDRRCKELAWVKERGSFSPEHYSRKHELIYYNWRKSVRWFGDPGETSVLEYHKPSSFGYELDDGSKNTGNKSLIHPTQKPVDLLTRLIENSSTVNDIVVDPFCGSGSTLIACVKTRRQAFTMDIDPIWIAKTLDRAAKLGLEISRGESEPNG